MLAMTKMMGTDTFVTGEGHLVNTIDNYYQHTV